MVTKQREGDKMQKELASRQDYESALETLKRFAEMVGGNLTQPSGIIRRFGRGQWQTYQVPQIRETPYSSRERGKAK